MKVRIKNEPTAAQRKVLKKEVIREFNELLARYNHSTAVQVMHILRFNFGFGQERLQRFADKLCEMQKHQEEFYELPPDDTPWICEKQLRDSGIDVDAILEDK